MKATAADWTRQNDGNATITAESCLPSNGFIDPGETNTVSFVIKNTSGGDRTEVKVNILEQGGVTFRSGEVNVGSVAKDATFTVSFSFRANGSCGGTLTPTLQIASKDRTTETVTFNGFQLGATVKTTYGGSNTTPIVINDFNADSAKLGRATPYPSSITISGVPKIDSVESVDKVTVTLNNISHGYSQDIQALLVAPNGMRIALIGDAGGSQSGVTAPISDVTLTFDESAAGKIPQNAGQIVSGTYKTSDYNTTAYTFPDVGAANASSLTALNNMADPNGTWRLYVIDASTGDPGTIAGGWSLSIRTTKIACCSAGQLFPFVTRIGEATVDEDLGGGKDVTIANFTAWDIDDTDATKLTISATSSDQTKVTDSNLVIDGTGTVDNTVHRSVRVKQLVSNASGNVTITVVVTDPQGHTSTSSFNLKINPKNDAPTITDILGQKVTTGTATGPLSFTIGDVETLPENLLVLVASDNVNVVPVQNIVVSGFGANRTVNVFPRDANTSGSATITLTVRDAGQPGDNSAAFQETSKSFIVNFSAQAGNPTITPYVNASGDPTVRTVDEDSSITIPFQVRSGNPNVSPDSLVLTKQTSNPNLLPVGNIVFGGSGIDRTMTLTPVPNANGEVIVTITVSNGSAQDSTSIRLVVAPVNDAPTITTVGPQITNEDTTSGDIVFTVGDVETLNANLDVTISTDNSILVPNIRNPADLNAAGGYTVAANAGARTIRIRPAPNVFGKANVTVTVTDTGDPIGSTSAAPEKQRPKTSSTSFVLTVNPVNDPPRITGVQNAAGPGNAAAGDTTERVWVGDTDPTLIIAEDSGSTSPDDTKGQRTIILTGVTPGPISPADASEANQSVSISAVSNKPDVISVLKTELKDGVWRMTVKLGDNRFTPSDSLAEITLTLQDTGGTALGGNDTTTKKFKVNVTPINDAPTIAFPTLPAPLPNQTLSELNVPKNRSFTVPMNLNDVETPRTLMDVTVGVTDDSAHVFTDASGNPNANVLVDLGRTLVTFIPNSIANVTLPYTVTVTITAKDRGATNSDTDRSTDLTVSRTFKVTIRDIEPPSLTASSTDVSTDEDVPASIVLTVSDNHPVNNLTFSVKSDNEAMIPKDNVVFGPLVTPNANTSTRQFAIIPAADQFGVANVTIIAKDDETLESQLNIKVTVRPVNDAPKITLVGAIAPTFDANGNIVLKTVQINEDSTTKDESDAATNKQLSFDVADAVNETPVERLTITKNSSNTTLVPLDNIVISTTGNRRTVSVTPAANRNGGPVTITISVTDETGLTGQAQFRLQVLSVNDAPTIASIANMTLQETTNPQATTVNLTGISAGPDPGDVRVDQTLPAADAADGQISSVTVSVKDKGSDPAVNNLIASIGPVSSITSDGKASFQFTPRASVAGIATFTVTVNDTGSTARDGKNTTSTSFDVAIQRVNAAPTISFDASTTTVTIDRTIAVGGQTEIIPFFIGDAETGAVNLTVSATSSNPTLIPNDPANLQLGGSGANRGILIKPASGQFGTAAVVVTVRDADGGTKTATVNVTVTPGQAPAVTVTPASQQIHVNEFSDLVQVNLFDAQSPNSFKFGYDEAGLVTSDNTALVPASPSNIQFGGTGASRVMIVLPARDQTGTAHISLRARDADGNLSAPTVFTLTVLGSAPTISQATPSAVDVDLGRQSPVVTVQVGDKETFPALLTVTGKSSDQTVIADNNIFVLGNNTSRSVTVLAGNKGGTATITLTVTDAEGQTATTSFIVRVADNNTDPTITTIAPQSTTKNKPTGVITFVVGDAQSAPANLTVTATSANTTLVPNSSANLLLLTSPSNPASRSLVITPATDQTGTALITVKVTDEGGKTAERSFSLTVTATSVANDFNGDGTQDIILQDNGGFVAAWFMSGDDVLSTSFLTPNNVGDAGWSAVGSGDFDGDGKPDLLFQHKDGWLAVWKLNGVTLASASMLTPSSSGAWKAVSVGDFNKDGKADILFQYTDGSLAVWLMDGLSLSSVAALKPGNAGAGWSVIGTGDVNGDTNLDILFQHTDGSLAVWYLTGGTNVLLASLLTPNNPGDGNWRAVGTIDLNGDSKPDLLFQNRADNNIAVWYMNGPRLVLGKLLNPSNPGGTWRVVAP